MQMIPATPYNNQSRAELDVFDALRTAFTSDNDLGLTAYHSLNLTHHATKRFGEIDFLIVGRAGIYVIEVKGGGIRCKNGQWQTTKGNGETKALRESPFQQANTGLHALMTKIKAEIPQTTWSKFTIGYGVIFSDCHFEASGSEWDRECVADRRSMRNLQRWLSKLFAYWQNKEKYRHAAPQNEDLDILKRFIRPGFETAIALHTRVGDVEKRVAALTNDQMRMVDVIEANSRVLCTGGAGTGKTFLALEIARRWAAKDLHILVVCRSPWLRHWLEARFTIHGVTVALGDSVARAAKRQAIERFDAVIVDEGQDILDMDILDSLDNYLIGGLESGRWCFFHDINNQAGFYGTADPEALALLESFTASRVPLTTNCRNTRQILEEVQNSLGTDLGVDSAADGPKIRKSIAESPADAARLLIDEIKWLSKGGVEPGSITILSPLMRSESVVALLPQRYQTEIQTLDEFAIRTFPAGQMGFAGIGDFKGLENDAVIVVDIQTSDELSNMAAQRYVAMSRPRAILSIILSTN